MTLSFDMSYCWQHLTDLPCILISGMRTALRLHSALLQPRPWLFVMPEAPAIASPKPPSAGCVPTAKATGALGLQNIKLIFFNVLLVRSF
jgi:hypothetical protein